ncbi:ribokinase [Vallitaleaceae bacterium 9-2]
MSEIVVVGSINTDLVFVSQKRPKAGETILGDEFLTIPGGKGANQAVASAKLGKDVSIIGCVGNDIYGEKMLKNFIANGVDTSMIEVLDISTGVAGIMVDNEDNSIVVIPGANKLLSKAMIDKHMDVLKGAKVVILQLEIPMDVIEYVIDICHQNHIISILNPAPARKVPEQLIEKVSYLTPNEHEAVEIFGKQAIDDLLKQYPNKLIITQGDQGVVFFDGQYKRHIASLSVDVVDTTGAGDTFNGALATCLVSGQPLLEAIEYANKVAAISITKYGAQGGMPTREDVERWGQLD